MPFLYVYIYIYYIIIIFVYSSQNHLHFSKQVLEFQGRIQFHMTNFDIVFSPQRLLQFEDFYPNN